MTQKMCSFLCLIPTLGACSDPDECGKELGKPSYTLDNPSPRATGASLELTGAMSSDIRLKSFTIGGVAVAGTDNYAVWKAAIPANVVEKYRSGTTSTLPVAARDACDAVTELPSIGVKAEAEPGTAADDLAVELLNDDCFLPANGSQKAEVVVTAAAEAVGVRVALTTSAGVLLGARDSDKTVVLAQGDNRAEARAFLHPAVNAEGLVSVTANAGTAFASTPSYPIALAPRFVGPTSVLNGKPAFISVDTAGRLKSCSARSTVSGSAVFSAAEAAPSDILNTDETAELDTEGCGQSALFKADFTVGVPESATITLRCIDQRNQAASYVLTSQGDPPPPAPP